MWLSHSSHTALAGGILFLKRSTGRRVGGTSTEAQRIVQNAERQAESQRD